MAARMRTRRVPLILLWVVALMLAACSSGESSQASGDTNGGDQTDEAGETPADDEVGGETSADVPGVTDEEIRVVSTTGLSGNFAAVTGPYVAAINAVLERVNADGGVHGRQIVWDPSDDGFDVQRAVTTAQRYAEADDVFAAAFPFGTSPTIAKSPIYERAGIPYFELGTFLGMYEGETPATQFGCVTPYYYQALAAIRYVQDNIDGNRWAALVYAADDGAEVSRALETAAEGGDIEIVSEQEYEPGTTDFSGQLSALTEVEFDHLLIYGSVPDSARVAEAASRAGVEATIVGPMTAGDPQFLDLVGELGEGVIAGVPTLHPTSDDPAVEAARQEFEELADSDAQLGTFAISGYHCAEVFVEVLERAGENPTRESLVEGFESLDGFETGIGAPVTYGPDDHVGGTSARVVQVQDGQWVDVGGDWIEAED